MNDFWSTYGFPFLIMLGQSLLLLVVLLVVIAYILLADRKIWAAVQMRRGPNVVGAFGLMQSFADLGKFVLKEPVIPAGADKTVFLLAPLVTVILSLAAWAVVPVAEGSACTASSWAAGRPTRNIRSSARCVRRRRWSPTRSPSASSSSPF